LFVGHGLDSDFRVVNLVVPPSQIRDTVQLFWIAGQRKLSLRFLAAVLLKEDIQEKVHDSIQDARAALKLYHLYLELQRAGLFEDTLRKVYEEGPRRNWS
jgi:PAB-dependent poly(A)-specific ribonuclease subunit 2